MTFRLIAIATDSQGVYFNSSPSTLPGYLADPGGYIFKAGATYWGYMVPGENTGTANNPTAWGIEVPLSHYLHQLFPGDTFGFVKIAVGSTRLDQTAGTLDWSPNSTGELFDQMTQTIADARSAFSVAQGYPAPQVSAVVMMLGTNDATDAGAAARHEANLVEFFAAAREEWMGDPEGKIIFPRIGDAPVIAYNADVRVAEWSVDQADENAISFKTIGMGVQADGYHYDAAGVVSIGQAVASIYDGWF